MKFNFGWNTIPKFCILINGLAFIKRCSKSIADILVKFWKCPLATTLAKRFCWAILLSLKKLFRHSFLLLRFFLELKMRNAATACTNFLSKTVQLGCFVVNGSVACYLVAVDSRKGNLLACYQVASVCRIVNVPLFHHSNQILHRHCLSLSSAPKPQRLKCKDVEISFYYTSIICRLIIVHNLFKAELRQFLTRITF